MEQVWGLHLDTLLALAAILLGLSIAAQVLQEIYRYVTSSRSRMYRIALRDFLGSWVDEIYARKGPDYEQVNDLFLRGPFQFKNGRKKAHLLPMEKKDLLNALNRTAPDWQSKVIEALKKEAAVQQGQAAAPSPILCDLVYYAWEGRTEGSGQRKVFEFLKDWGVVKEPVAGDLEPELSQQIDAARLLEAFYQKFLPNRAKVDEHFDQLTANFEHAYGRRNLRQTLGLAIVLVLGLNMPFSELYRKANSLSPEETEQLANSLVELYEATSRGEGEVANSDQEEGKTEDEATEGDREETETDNNAVDADAGIEEEELRDLMDELKVPIRGLLKTDDPDRPIFSRGVDQLGRLWIEPGKIPGYLADCLLTVLLISFGAPFWDRLSQALLGVRSATRREADNPETS